MRSANNVDLAPHGRTVYTKYFGKYLSGNITLTESLSYHHISYPSLVIFQLKSEYHLKISVTKSIRFKRNTFVLNSGLKCSV